MIDKRKCEFCGWEYQPRSKRSRFCSSSCRVKGKAESKGSVYIKCCSECGSRLPKDRITTTNVTQKAYCVRCQKDYSKPIKTGLEKDVEEAKKKGLSYGHYKASQLPKMKKILYLKKHNGVTIIVRES